MSHKEFVSVIEPMPAEPLSTPLPSNIGWGNLLAFDCGIVTFRPTFDELYLSDIVSYAQQVQDKAAYQMPQVAQTMLKVFHKELQQICITTELRAVWDDNKEVDLADYAWRFGDDV
ncbi:hypothetical protein GYMLUDRAFT_60687 [Collybiopsis luxurians FD-317 M1]|uniref:Uncharacterized protein n=1 Tax=Collybiopsis luxurians FD-317 M1 TaxID=944289 RepID=A0A0D0CRS8_9AGAR|nr:hypothetical protein GYMLUDRAFT_60687 [Collybiopsis luxurians FD-317 M1]